MGLRPIVETIGLEFETEDVTSRAIANSIGHVGYFNQTHDASIESDYNSILGGEILLRKSELVLSPGTVGNRGTIGTEIITIPINTESEDILRVLKTLTFTLEELGESNKSFRAGIHIHVCSSFNLISLKRFMRLGRWLEDVFYYIGGNGYEFRGMMVNESLYCRPITKFGPQVVENARGGFSQLYNIDDLLTATSCEEFFERYGDVDPNNISRYHPVRYTWLNLYSLLAHGTLEFRVFNKTLNPFYIFHEILLCKEFTRYALGSAAIPSTENSIYDERSKDEIIHTLRQFCSMVDLESKVYERIINRTSDIILPKRYVFSHLRGLNASFRREYNPPTIQRKDIVKIEVDDIHNRRGERN